MPIRHAPPPRLSALTSREYDMMAAPSTPERLESAEATGSGASLWEIASLPDWKSEGTLDLGDME